MNESEEHAQTSARPLCRENVPVVSQTLEQLGTGVAKAKGKEGINLLVAAAHLGVLIGISSLAVLTFPAACSGVTALASTDQ